MGILSSLFKKKPIFQPADLSLLGCDIHSHLIPGIDDGSPSVEDSLSLLQEFSSFGYKKVVTTPHIMSDYYRNTPENILSGLDILRHAIIKENIPIEIDAAAEYYLDDTFIAKIKEKKLLTFGKNYVLFELSFMEESPYLNQAIFEMQLAGYKPVLAHAERYTFWHGNFNKFTELVDKGVLLQLNINSLTGYYSPDTKKIAEKIIDNNLFSFLGSDCHHDGHIKLMKNCLTEEYLHKVINSGRLLNLTLV